MAKEGFWARRTERGIVFLSKNILGRKLAEIHRNHPHLGELAEIGSAALITYLLISTFGLISITGLAAVAATWWVTYMASKAADRINGTGQNRVPALVAVPA